VDAILPNGALDIDQLQVGLVDEIRRLQGVRRRLTEHLSSRQPTQLLVEDRHQLVESRAVAVPRIGQQLANR
jgi:hypothetical protein